MQVVPAWPAAEAGGPSANPSLVHSNTAHANGMETNTVCGTQTRDESSEGWLPKTVVWP